MYIWTAGAGKRKLAGITPTISYDSPPSVTRRPMTDVAPPNWRRQKSWLSTTSLSFAPRTISSSRGTRPTSGATPSVFQNPGETNVVEMRCGSPMPVRSVPLIPSM